MVASETTDHQHFLSSFVLSSNQLFDSVHSHHYHPQCHQSRVDHSKGYSFSISVLIWVFLCIAPLNFDLIQSMVYSHDAFSFTLRTFPFHEGTVPLTFGTFLVSCITSSFYFSFRLRTFPPHGETVLLALWTILTITSILDASGNVKLSI